MELEDLNLDPQILEAVKKLGYTKLTEIQKKCIPKIMQGKDVFGQSSTGSGKTAAFGLPMINSITPKQGLQALILTPTRELCVQVSESLKDFGKFKKVHVISVYGGVGIEKQIQDLRVADVVVGTPGRILDHIERRTINFHKLKIFVLDEADKMFEMGFVEAVEHILKHLPKPRQTLLFSATVSPEVYHVMKRHLNNPEMVKAEIYVDKSLLKQVYYNVRSPDKFSLLMHLLKKKQTGLSVVFCATRRETDVVARNLKQHGLKAKAIHGGLTQAKRLEALNLLKNEHINVLVATDVAARGLDIKNVSQIYNYDVPRTSEEYVHRIGRTARAGSSGEAITLLTDKDYDNFNNVLRDRTLKIEKGEVPHFEKVQFLRSFKDDEGQSRGGSYGGQRGGNRGSGSRGFGNRSSGGRSGGGGNRFGRREDNRGPQQEGRPHDGGGKRHSGGGGDTKKSSNGKKKKQFFKG